MNQGLWSQYAKNAVVATVLAGFLTASENDQLSLYIASRNSSLMSFPEVNNSECYIWSGSWCHHYPQEDMGLKFWLLTGSQRVTFSPPVSSQEKKPKWPLHRSPCIVLASFWFSLSLDTLESFWTMHLIYSKGVHAWPGFQISIFVGFFFFFFLHQLYSSEWKLLAFKAADEIGLTVALCVLGCLEIKFPYFLNWKSVLFFVKYEWLHGKNGTEYLKPRMLGTVQDVWFL